MSLPDPPRDAVPHDPAPWAASPHPGRVSLTPAPIPQSETGSAALGASSPPRRASFRILPHHSGQASAFSLVEITLALGIVAFALLAIFGLLPVAIDSSRESAKDATFSAITERVVGDLRSRGYDWLTNASATPAPNTVWPYAFDSDGRPVATNSPNRAFQCDVVQGVNVNPNSLAITTNALPNTVAGAPRIEFYLQFRYPYNATQANQDVRTVPMIIADYE